MSGLVNGLQNRLQQFESARHLKREGIASQQQMQSLLLSFIYARAQAPEKELLRK